MKNVNRFANFWDFVNCKPKIPIKGNIVNQKRKLTAIHTNKSGKTVVPVTDGNFETFSQMFSTTTSSNGNISINIRNSAGNIYENSANPNSAAVQHCHPQDMIESTDDSDKDIQKHFGRWIFIYLFICRKYCCTLPARVAIARERKTQNKASERANARQDSGKKLAGND